MLPIKYFKTVFVNCLGIIQKIDIWYNILWKSEREREEESGMNGNFTMTSILLKRNCILLNLDRPLMKLWFLFLDFFCLLLVLVKGTRVTTMELEVLFLIHRLPPLFYKCAIISSSASMAIQSSLSVLRLPIRMEISCNYGRGFWNVDIDPLRIGLRPLLIMSSFHMSSYSNDIQKVCINHMNWIMPIHFLITLVC